MREKLVDLSKSVYELSRECPEIVAILGDLGFEDIGRPGLLATAGRLMTIPKGARMKGLDLEKIKAGLVERGFTVLDGRDEHER